MDVTMQLIEAQEARSRMQEAKKRIKAEVRRKYESAINLEIAERSQDAEIEFARTLARVHGSGVSQALLRREVLRTNVWGVWTYWRDLAGIDPERVSVKSAKAERARAESPFQFSADYSVLTVTKDSTGADLAEPVVYDLTTVSWANNKWWAASADNTLGLSDAERTAMRGDKKYKQYVSDEIQRQIDAGNIDNPLERE